MEAFSKTRPSEICVFGVGSYEGLLYSRKIIQILIFFIENIRKIDFIK